MDATSHATKNATDITLVKQPECFMCHEPAIKSHSTVLHGTIHLCRKHAYPATPKAIKAKRQARNAKCECGSGLKYKQCCALNGKVLKPNL